MRRDFLLSLIALVIPGIAAKKKSFWTTKETTNISDVTWDASSPMHFSHILWYEDGPFRIPYHQNKPGAPAWQGLNRSATPIRLK